MLHIQLQDPTAWYILLLHCELQPLLKLLLFTDSMSERSADEVPPDLLQMKKRSLSAVIPSELPLKFSQVKGEGSI